MLFHATEMHVDHFLFILLQKGAEITEELQKLLGCDLLFHYNNFRLFCLFRNASVIKISRGGRCRSILFYYRKQHK